MHLLGAPLTEEQVITLNEMASHHPHGNFRPRALGILAINDDEPVAAIARILRIHTLTVYRWAKAWHELGLSGILGGHEGGANTLAFRVANLIGAEPVISTTTEAVKDLIVGVGCRRGAAAGAIVDAVRRTLRKEGLRLERVRVLASAEIKADEPGLHAAARELGLPLRFVAGDEIRSTAKAFRHSPFVIKKVNLPAVAEPSALLAGRRTQLIRPRIILNGVTVAIARENCSSLASGRAARSTGRDGPNKPLRKAALLSATSITSKTSRI